ncbi:unnamed protein product [Rotaria magnacalcarata]|uniref:Ubiquitin-like protease family profile domain-containing protein n=1 Tax=Rotaria magnacalcarata TaxID=392030 RepID=A0A8S2L157_9BILA|nr:unnamed protein product [Rotaria magnacalcarata]
MEILRIVRHLLDGPLEILVRADPTPVYRLAMATLRIVRHLLDGPLEILVRADPTPVYRLAMATCQLKATLTSVLVRPLGYNNHSLSLMVISTVLAFELRTANVSSIEEKPSVSFYSSRKRIDHALLITNGRMAKKSKPTPEIICLSDDDDNNNKNNQISVPIVNPIKSPPSSSTSSTIVNGDNKIGISQVSDWIIQRKDVMRIPELTMKHSDLIKKTYELACSAVCFGILEFKVESEIILMKETEFELKLKSDFMANFNIKLAYSDIISFFYSFQSQPPAAFIQVRPDFADLFAKYIPSTDEHGKGFDPHSKDERRRRIVLCLKSSPDTEKSNTSSIYYYLKAKSSTMNICCVSSSRGQEIYNLSRFANIKALGSITQPFVINANELASKTVGLNNNTIRFDLSCDDLLCLNEGEFLNDNIIDFYLQYVYYKKLSQEDRQRTYLFNSFFYTRLTRKGNDDIFYTSAAERRYNRVKRWLRDVDIFSKDYLIVPINQTAHWYLVVIQFHNNVPTEGDLISDDDESHDNRSNMKKKKITECKIQTNANNSTPGEASSLCLTSNIHPIEVLDEADEVTIKNDNQINPNSEKAPNRKNRSQTPAIIMFDSLRTGPKNRVAATLREFLQLEYDHKKTLPVGSSARKIFNLDTIPTIEAAVPQQPNYFDCGLYILQYMEKFFAHRSPTINYQLLSTFENWCDKNSMGSSKRKQIFDTINQYVIPKEV